MSLTEIYSSDKQAYQWLKIKWQRRKLGQKPYGVEEAIKKLENKLNIDQNKRVFPYKPLFFK